MDTVKKLETKRSQSQKKIVKKTHEPSSSPDNFCATRPYGSVPYEEHTDTQYSRSSTE
jgi:hypothetical protein